MSDFFNLKIVAISHFISRSGTLYLHSLLDNHPQIASIPGTINIVDLLEIKKNATAEECYQILLNFLRLLLQCSAGPRFRPFGWGLLAI